MLSKHGSSYWSLPSKATLVLLLSLLTLTPLLAEAPQLYITIEGKDRPVLDFHDKGSHQRGSYNTGYNYDGDLPFPVWQDTSGQEPFLLTSSRPESIDSFSIAAFEPTFSILFPAPSASLPKTSFGF